MALFLTMKKMYGTVSYDSLSRNSMHLVRGDSFFQLSSRMFRRCGVLFGADCEMMELG